MTNIVNSELVTVFNKLLENQKDQSLPTQDIEPFDGKNILNYQTFITNFQFVVERNTDDPARRLEFLLKYTKGDAHELIKFCPLIDPPKSGYERARFLLKRDFGDLTAIAATLMNEADNLPKVTSGDKKGLRKFSLFLINCINSKQNNREM